MRAWNKTRFPSKMLEATTANNLGFEKIRFLRKKSGKWKTSQEDDSLGSNGCWCLNLRQDVGNPKGTDYCDQSVWNAQVVPTLTAWELVTGSLHTSRIHGTGQASVSLIMFQKFNGNQAIRRLRGRFVWHGLRHQVRLHRQYVTWLQKLDGLQGWSPIRLLPAIFFICSLNWKQHVRAFHWLKTGLGQMPVLYGYTHWLDDFAMPLVYLLISFSQVCARCHIFGWFPVFHRSLESFFFCMLWLFSG